MQVHNQTSSKVLSSVLQNVEMHGYGNDLERFATAKSILEKVSNTAAFRHDETDESDKKKRALIARLASHTAASLSMQPRANFIKFMQFEIERLLFRILTVDDATIRHMCHILPENVNIDLFVIQSALHRRFPLLSSEGLYALTKPPIIYLTEGSSLYAHLPVVAWASLVGRNGFRVIPTVQYATPSDGKSAEVHDVTKARCIDLKELEAAIIQDKNNGCLPVCVFAVSGGNLHDAKQFQSDDITGMREICDRHGLWLHTQASGMLLALSSDAVRDHKLTKAFMRADSWTVQPQTWMEPQNREVVSVVCIRQQDGRKASTAHLMPGTDTNAMCRHFTRVFTLWFALARTSVQEILDRANECYKSAVTLHAKWTTQDEFVGAVGPDSGAQGTHPHMLLLHLSEIQNVPVSVLNISINELNQALYTHLINFASQATKDERKWDIDSSFSAFVYTALSQTVYQGRRSLLYHPFTRSTSEQCLNPYATAKNIDTIITATREFAHGLQLTLEVRGYLKVALAAQAPAFQFVEVKSVADAVGIGAVVYAPAFAAGLDMAQKEELNTCVLNSFTQSHTTLLRHLGIRAATAQRADGESHTCIVFGTVTSTELQAHIRTDVPAFASELATTMMVVVGRMPLPASIETSLSTLVQKGIEQAQTQIDVENYGQTSVPGTIVRALPIVGGIYSWLRPLTKPTPERVAHAFDIREGQVKVVAVTGREKNTGDEKGEEKTPHNDVVEGAVIQSGNDKVY